MLLEHETTLSGLSDVKMRNESLRHEFFKDFLCHLFSILRWLDCSLRDHDAFVLQVRWHAHLSMERIFPKLFEIVPITHLSFFDWILDF